MRVILSVSFLFLASIQALGQNYQDICSPGITIYQNQLNEVKAFRLDSAKALGTNDSVFYSYRTIRDSLGFLPVCYDTTNGSVLGNRVRKRPDGWFEFYNRYIDTLWINTQAALNETWTFCHLPFNCRIKATISSIYPDSTFGFQDSVKLILLQAKDQNGNNISHIMNGKTLRLSRNWGLKTTMNMPDIPYDTVSYSLAGKEHPEAGLQDLSWSSVYSFDIGDEFHYSYHYLVNNAGVHKYTIERILDKNVLGDTDTLVYTLEVCWKRYSPGVYQQGFDTVQTIISKNSYPPYTQGNFLPPPEELRRRTDNPEYADEYYATTSSFNHRLTKGIHELGYTFTDHCWQGGFGELAKYYEYTFGLGTTRWMFWESSGGWVVEEAEQLIYFNKSGETWGNPLSEDCNHYVGIGSQAHSQENEIILSPNPASQVVSVACSSYRPISDLKIEVYDPTGRVVFEDQMKVIPYQLVTYKLQRGVFIVVISDRKGNIFGRAKLILN